HSVVKSCGIYAGPNAPARGGGIFAQHDIYVAHSLVTYNYADAKITYGIYKSYQQPTYGGGLFSGGLVTIVDSTISDNRAQSAAVGGCHSLERGDGRVLQHNLRQHRQRRGGFRLPVRSRDVRFDGLREPRLLLDAVHQGCEERSAAAGDDLQQHDLGKCHEF